MRLILLLLATLASFSVCAADIKYKAKGSESAASIIADVCLHDIATGTLRYASAASEDAGLVIKLTSSDGTVALVYDATTEVETITTNYTWAAPSASNIRFKVQTNGCYQLMPAANTFDVGDYMFLTIADSSSPAFMDYESLIMFLGTSTDAQLDVVAGLTTYTAATQGNVDGVETDVAAVQTVVDTHTTTLATLSGYTDDIGIAGAGLTAIPDLDSLLEALVLTTELTADSGTTATLVDAALTEASNNWFSYGAAIVFTSSTLARQVRCVVGFTASSDTIRFAPPTTAAVSTQTYYLMSAPGCAVLGVP